LSNTAGVAFEWFWNKIQGLVRVMTAMREKEKVCVEESIHCAKPDEVRAHESVRT
jgi:hypothetical protein